MGFTAVQVSPPMEHIQGDQWWTRYQPVSYNLTSRSGDEDGFADMTKRCANAGVEIYADGVVNHMAAAVSTTAYGTGGTAYGPGRKYEPYNWDPEMMHHLDGNSNSNCAVTDYTDLTNVQECDLVGLVDLNTEEDAVRQTIGGYITKLRDLGATGVRIDAAKHINTDSLGAFLGYAPSDMFVFQEVIYGDGEASQPEMYIQNGDVTEFRYGTNIYNQFNSGASEQMQYLENFGEAWGMIASESAVTFTDNHDTQRSSSNVLTYKDGQYYNAANYFMLAHPYGYPKVMSSYYFTDTDAGPPSTPVHDGSHVNCDDGSTWVCEHRRTGIANMVAFRASAAGEESTEWQFDDSNGNRLSFGRGAKGFFALNMDPNSEWSNTFSTSVPDGTYTNAIDGTTEITVSGGQVSLTVPALDAVAFHV
jgi:alpha-amylase